MSGPDHGWQSPSTARPAHPGDGPAYQPAPGRPPGSTGVAGQWPGPPAGPVPWYAAERRSSWRPTGAELRGALVVVVALAVAGLAVGLLWYAVAPRPTFEVLEGGFRRANGPEERFAADAWFFFLTLGVGLVAGVGTWLWRSARGPTLIVALAVGGLGGALLTWWVGQQLASPPTAEELSEVGALVKLPLELRATSAVVVEPFAAVVLYIVAAGFAARDDLSKARRR